MFKKSKSNGTGLVGKTKEIFSLAYWQINVATKQGQRKIHGTPFLAKSVKPCASMAVVALASAICGWWSLRNRRLPFEVRKNCCPEHICLLMKEYRYLRSSKTHSSQYVQLHSWEAKLARRSTIVSQHLGTEL